MALVALLVASSGAEAQVRVNQVVIRAPAVAVAAALVERPSDAELREILNRWVADGRAEMVSETKGSALAVGEPIKATTGKYMRWPSEYDQDFENLLLTPESWETTLVGSSLSVAPPERFRATSDRDREYIAGYSPRGPATVKWPLVWPLNRVPRVAWLEQLDFFTETVKTFPWHAPPGTNLLGILPPGDAMELQTTSSHQVDVFIAEVETPENVPYVATPLLSNPGTARLVVIGIGVKGRLAMELGAKANPSHDLALLRDLLKLTSDGRASLRTLSALNMVAGGRCEIESGRGHVYPSEMPTIPSAWNNANVGLKVEAHHQNAGSVSLEIARQPTFPRRAEWPCALDAPELVMWQPQYQTQTLVTSVDLAAGQARLIGMMNNPVCLANNVGQQADETLFLFAMLDEANLHARVQDAPNPKVLVEAVVFEVPASEKGDWIEIKDDSAQYERLITRVEAGTATIGGHLQLAVSPGSRGIIQNVEAVKYVAEYNPDYEDVPGRYRPTAFDVSDCGMQLEVDTYSGSRLGALQVGVTHSLKYDTSRPRELPLPEALAFAKANHAAVLQAEVFQEEWVGSMNMDSGQARFLGARQPRDVEHKANLLLAFIKVLVSN